MVADAPDQEAGNADDQPGTVPTTGIAIGSGESSVPTPSPAIPAAKSFQTRPRSTGAPDQFEEFDCMTAPPAE